MITITSSSPASPTSTTTMMPLENYFSQLNVLDEDPSTCCAATSSSDRRKKRRLNAPSPDSVGAADAGVFVSELKRSSAARQLHRHSHHAGDQLMDFYREVAPNLVGNNTNNNNTTNNTTTRRSSHTPTSTFSKQQRYPRRSGSTANDHKTLGSRFQDLLVRDTLLEYGKEQEKAKNTRKSSPAAFEVRTVRQLLAKVESIVDV